MRWDLGGQLRVVASGSALDFRGRRSLDVLAVLLIHRRDVVSVDRLVDELWPESPPASARNAVQRFVSDIRTGLGDQRQRLVSEPGGYRLLVDDDDVDVGRAERLIRSALDQEPGPGDNDALTATLADLRAGIVVLSRPLCAGSSSLHSVVAEAQRLTNLREVAIERAAGLQVASYTADLNELEQWHSELPFNERLAGHLMRALAAVGRQHDALAVHHRLRGRLVETLGVSPGPEINAIEIEILNQQVEIAKPASAHRSSVGEALRNPTATSTHALIGRTALLADVHDALDQHRIVTLVGLGGVGKTSLATAIAAERRNEGEARVVLLADLQDGDQVIDAIASTLDLAPRQGERSTQQLTHEIATIAAGAGLLVIDNAEHVIGAIADLLTQIVARPGAGRVLITSRERLAIAQECVVDIAPLALPTAELVATEASAVRLLATRGAAVSELTYNELINEPTLVDVCRLLDGLPLALELAAAQLRLFSPSELLARLKSSGHVLGSRRGPQRQRSLYELLDWSWQLLPSAEQELLAELSLYRGWTAAAVDRLAPMHTMASFAALVDKSLIGVERVAGEPTRYRMLETVRSFCLDQLEATPTARDRAAERHAAWVLSEAEQCSIAESFVCTTATRRFMDERPNLLLALEFLIETSDVAGLVRLLALTGGSFAHHGSVLEGHEWFERAEPLARATREQDPGALDDDTYGGFLTAGLDVGLAAGDLEAGLRRGLEAIELAGTHPYDWAPNALCSVAVVLETGLLDHSGEELMIRGEALASATESARLNAAHTAIWRGEFEFVNRNYVGAIEAFERALEIEPRPGRILLLGEIGIVVCLFLQQRYEEADAAAETMQSRSDSDTWHYLVDIIRAIAIGGVDARAGARWLEASLKATGESDFEGRAGDQRIATGVLAWHGGDRDLCKRMLERPLGRGPAQVVLLTEYFDGNPGEVLTATQWRTRYRSIMQRHELLDHNEDPLWIRYPPDFAEFRGALLSLVG